MEGNSNLRNPIKRTIESDSTEWCVEKRSSYRASYFPRGLVYDITIFMIMIFADVFKVGGDEIVTGD